MGHGILLALRTSAAVVALFAVGQSALGQSTSGTRSGLCWQGRQTCSAFMILEVQVGFDMLHGFDPEVDLGVGVMANLSNDWAAGGRLALALGGSYNAFGLRVRGRRWLESEVGLDLEAGASRVFPDSRYRGDPDAWSLTTGGRLNWKDLTFGSLRYDASWLPDRSRVTPGPSQVVPPRTLRHALLAGGGVGSTPAAVIGPIVILITLFFVGASGLAGA